jgi:hypothetical protein
MKWKGELNMNGAGRIIFSAEDIKVLQSSK